MKNFFANFIWFVLVFNCWVFAIKFINGKVSVCY